MFPMPARGRNERRAAPCGVGEARERRRMGHGQRRPRPLLGLIVGLLTSVASAHRGAAASATGPATGPATGRPPVAVSAKPSAEELFQGTVKRVAVWFDASRTNLPAVESTWEITSTEGMSPGLVGQRMQYRVQAPERAQLQGRIGNEPFTLGRDRNELWLWRPQKGVVWRARATSAEPLYPLAVPALDSWLRRLPDFFAVQALPAAPVNGMRCQVVSGAARPAACHLMGLPAFQLTFWLGAADQRLRQIRLAVPEEGWAMTAMVRSLQECGSKDLPRWSGPVTATNRVEWVTIPRVRGAFPDAIHELGLLRLLAP